MQGVTQRGKGHAHLWLRWINNFLIFCLALLVGLKLSLRFFALIFQGAEGGKGGQTLGWFVLVTIVFASVFANVVTKLCNRIMTSKRIMFHLVLLLTLVLYLGVLFSVGVKYFMLW